MKTTLTRTASILGMFLLLFAFAGAATAEPGSSSSSRSRDRAAAARRETGKIKGEISQQHRGETRRVDPGSRGNNSRYDGHRDDHRNDHGRDDKDRYDRERHDRDRYDRDRYDRYDHDRHDRNRYDHGRYDRDRYDHGRFEHRHGASCGHYDVQTWRRSSYFEVPRVIFVDRAPYYRDYYYGQVWVPEHGHFHTIYRFPVLVGYQWVYRPYAYCDDNFYATGSFGYDGPVFDVNIRFDF